MASKNRLVKNDSQSVSRFGNSIDQGELLKKAIQRVISEPIFENFEKHGNSTWSPSALVILAILTAWMPCPQLTQAFVKASNLSTKLFGILAIQTYQGMMRALVTNGSSLLLVIWHRIHHLMETVSPTHFRIEGWLPLAVDGTRFTTPRTKSNETAFAAKNYGSSLFARSRKKWKINRAEVRSLPPSSLKFG